MSLRWTSYVALKPPKAQMFAKYRLPVTLWYVYAIRRYCNNVHNLSFVSTSVHRKAILYHFRDAQICHHSQIHNVNKTTNTALVFCETKLRAFNMCIHVGCLLVLQHTLHVHAKAFKALHEVYATCFAIKWGKGVIRDITWYHMTSSIANFAIQFTGLDCTFETDYYDYTDKKLMRKWDSKRVLFTTISYTIHVLQNTITLRSTQFSARSGLSEDSAPFSASLTCSAIAIQWIDFRKNFAIDSTGLSKRVVKTRFLGFFYKNLKT